MDRARQDFEAAGARLVLIGQLTPRHAAHFRRRQEIHLPVLADNDRTSYRAAGAKKGSAGDLFSPGVVAKGIMTSLKTGKTQTRPIGDTAQLGGSMVVAQDGRVAWSHMSKNAGDNAEPDEILAAVKSAA
ncbi:MAG: AhpC/TSA family protein [Solirubrobacteraceae bacterium]